jgi:hypothetical protein
MKVRLLSIALSLLVCTSARADELSDAMAMHQKREYQQAMQVFSKLANQGNVLAQEQLAEMYWFGDGMPIDLKEAERWFTSAANAGSQKAKLSLAVMRARVARRDEIAYYSTRFDGGNLQFSKSGCVPPTVPAASKTNAEIAHVSEDIRLWSECYNQFVARLRAALPATKSIPKDLLDIMADEDLARATVLIEKVILSNADEAKTVATRVSSETESWKRATEDYVTATNTKRTGMTAAEYELYQRSVGTQPTQRLDRTMDTRGVATQKK